MRELPALVAHADWSAGAAKRWMAQAVLLEGRYRACAPAPVGEPGTFLQRMREAAGPHGAVFLGFDMPIGLPAPYAERAGINDFLSVLPELGRGEWEEFYEVAELPSDVTPRRPFYPRRPGDVRQRHLLDGLGLGSMRETLRRTDQARNGLRAATSIFWTFGPQQVGKATISGWRDVLGPALRSGVPEVAIWPYAGRLADLLRTGRVVLAEVYPGECYRHLGVSFSRRVAGERWGKTRQAARIANAGALIAWAQLAGVELEPALLEGIRDGFGPRVDGDDRFDSVAGLFGMLNVVLERQAAGEPDDELVRKVEGWMLGRPAHPYYSGGTSRARPGLGPVADTVRRGTPLAPATPLGLRESRAPYAPASSTQEEMPMASHNRAAPPLSGAEVLRAAHLEYLVTDLERAREFYVDLLGFVESGRDAERIYLRGLEEREHASLILRGGPQPGASHVAYRVADPDDLERLHRRFGELGLPARWVDGGEAHGRALRVRDPAGLPVEFYHESRPAERMLQEFHLHRGPGILRLDHFNCQVPDVRAEYDYYTRELGFRLTEYTESDEREPRLWAAWLTRKHTVHDLALMNGWGPRLHHAGFSVPDALGILRACDILAGAGRGAAIERGPGRHGLSNAMFVYLRDPDGNRIELYTGDYLTADPDAAPIRWSLEDPRRQTFWGHYTPDSWFQEAALVQSIYEDGWVPPSEPLLQT